ncbi:MAG: class I SAM-dependent methyltransferase, partial [Candidatus Omnitrophica bacterium]|nr:class I SAM-dependent methyltransferase [Candidatus Omnitrophota bacterium]
DTGLYSDHRDTRVLVRELAEGQSFLNLYAYTGAFTCAAAAGGARSTVTVDRSQTNLDWAKDNLDLNGFSSKEHGFAQSDVDSFLSQAAKAKERWSLVFVDPPSFFKDVKAGKAFDINRDHVTLLRQVLKVTQPGGTVFFSTNHQRFEPRLNELTVTDLRELTPQTIPEDYRNRNVHRCWRFRA